jgi:hypothetical protein
MKRLAAWVVLVSTWAHAEPPGTDAVRLAWHRGAGAEICPGEAELGRRVAARIGRDPFADDARRTIEARVERSGEQWRAEIRLFDENARPIAAREPLESTAAGCAALAEAVVLAVALTIDPDAALGAGAAAGAGASPAAPEPAPEQPAQTKPEPERPPASTPPRCPACPPQQPRKPPTPARASLRAIAAMGILPATAPGVSVAAEIEPVVPWSLGLAMIYLPEVDSDDGDLAFGLTAVEPFVCAGLIRSVTSSLSACAGGQLGSMHALSRGLRPIEPGDNFWFAPTVGPRARVTVAHPAELEIGAAAVVPLTTHEFVVRGRPGSAHRAANVGYIAWLGLGWVR